MTYSSKRRKVEQWFGLVKQETDYLTTDRVEISQLWAGELIASGGQVELLRSTFDWSC